MLFLLVAALAPGLVASGDPLAIDPRSAFQGPSWAHWFGTDESGRDVYTRVSHGTGSSLQIGVAATLIGLGLGAVLGTVAGMLGSVVDFTANLKTAATVQQINAAYKKAASSGPLR